MMPKNNPIYFYDLTSSDNASVLINPPEGVRVRLLTFDGTNYCASNLPIAKLANFAVQDDDLEKFLYDLLGKHRESLCPSTPPRLHADAKVLQAKPRHWIIQCYQGSIQFLNGPLTALYNEVWEKLKVEISYRSEAGVALILLPTQDAKGKELSYNEVKANKVLSGSKVYLEPFKAQSRREARLVLEDFWQHASGVRPSKMDKGVNDQQQPCVCTIS
jgi:hypothetical protein